MAIIKNDEPFYQISQVAKLLGITSDRLRTYEEEGLIRPHRTSNSQTGKRLYSLNEIEWLKIIRELIKLGVTIPLIRILLYSDIKYNTKSLREKDKEIVNLIKELKLHPIAKKIFSCKIHLG